MYELKLFINFHCFLTGFKWPVTHNQPT